MITIYFKSLKDKKVHTVSKVRSGSLIIADNVAEDELVTISQYTGLEIADLADVLDVYEMPRIERQDEGVIIHLRHPATAYQGLHTQLLTVIFTEKCCVLLSKKQNVLLDNLLEKSPQIITTQKSKLLLFLLRQTVKLYTKEIKKVGDEVLRQKRELSNVSQKDISLLVKNEDILNQYLSCLVPMRNVFEIISSGRHVKIYEEDEDLFQDVLIGLNQLVDICKVNLKSIVALRDSYQIIFTNKLNGTMKFLASFTIIMTIPNIVAGIFGMNVGLPLQNAPFAFFFVMNLIVISCVATLFFFYKKRWL